MSSTRWKRWIFFLPLTPCFLAGLLSSCTLFGGQSSDDKGLLVVAERFNKDLRWEDYSSAAVCIAPAAKEEFWDEVDRLQRLVRIMDFQVVDVAIADGGRSGSVTLRFRFYYKRSPQLQTKTLRQQWLFSEKDRAWQIVSDDLQKLMPD